MKTNNDISYNFQYNVIGVRMLINGEHYIQKPRPFYESDLIKIITGIRRSGKSVNLDQIVREIRDKSDNIINLNFEDKRVSANIANGAVLITYL